MTSFIKPSLDSWLDPGDHFGEPNYCPVCEEEGREGEVEGDKWEWWCNHEDCTYHGDNLGDV